MVVTAGVEMSIMPVGGFTVPAEANDPPDRS
jgi:hypothetical protein